jgi:hypothetical protein
MHFFLHIAGYGEDQSKRIQKSRYDSVSVFISDSSRLDDAFHNDTNPQINPQAFARLVESGETIARLIFFFCWIKLCLICFFVFFFQVSTSDWPAMWRICSSATLLLCTITG